MTPKQAKYLWSFEIRNSSARPLNWMHQRIDVKDTSHLISRCEQWENENPKTKDTSDAVTSLLKLYNPDFKFKELAPKTKTIIKEVEKEIIKEVEKEIIKEVEKEIIKTVAITQDMSLDQVIETILPVAKGATHIQDLFDLKKPVLPEVKTSKEYFKPENFDVILATLKLPKPVLLKGPAGSGKSLMGSELAKHLDLDFYCQSCTEGMRYAHIFGADRLTIDPETGQNVSEFELSKLMQKIQTPCLIMLDEIFSLDAGLLIGLNGLLESNTRKIETKGGLVAMHPQARIIATTNVDGRNMDRNYVGAGRVDGSSLDRFITYKHDYSALVEKNILNNLVKLDRDDVTAWFKTLRKEVQLSNISFDVSTRRLQTCVELINGAGLDPVTAFQASFLGQLSATELKKIGLDNLKSQREV